MGRYWRPRRRGPLSASHRPESRCATWESTGSRTCSTAEALYAIIGEGLRSDFPPLRTPDSRPDNLPTQLTTFVGRDPELAEAAGLLGLDPAPDPHGSGRHGQDPAVDPARLDRVRRLRRRCLLHPAGADPGPDAGRVADRLDRRGRPKAGADRSPRPSRNGCATARRSSSSTTSSRSSPRLRSSPTCCERHPGSRSSRRAGRPCGCTASRNIPCRGFRRRPIRPAGAVWSGSTCRVRNGRSTSSTLGQYAAVRLFIERAVAVRPGFAVTNENAPAVAGDLRSAARDAVGDRARCGARQAPRSRRDPGPSRAPARRAGGGLAGPAGPTADAARRDRLELRPARRRLAPAARSGVGVRRRIRPRGGRGHRRPIGRRRWRRARRAIRSRGPEPRQGRPDARWGAAFPAARVHPRIRRGAPRRQR